MQALASAPPTTPNRSGLFHRPVPECRCSDLMNPGWPRFKPINLGDRSPGKAVKPATRIRIPLPDDRSGGRSLNHDRRRQCVIDFPTFLQVSQQRGHGADELRQSTTTSGICWERIGSPVPDTDLRSWRAAQKPGNSFHSQPGVETGRPRLSLSEVVFYADTQSEVAQLHGMLANDGSWSPQLDPWSCAPAMPWLGARRVPARDPAA